MPETANAGREYCVRLYKAGPRRDQPEEEADRIQAEHLRYLARLRADGILLISGPVMDEAELKGVAIFNTSDAEQVKRLAAADPAVQAGRLVYEVYHWWGRPGDRLPE